MHCNNQEYVKPWTAIRIQPHNARVVTTQEPLDEEEDLWDWAYSDKGMADLVQVGDNFVVPATPDNDEGVSFYIL